MAKGIQRGETEERAGWANARSACQATGEEIDYSNRQPLDQSATQKEGTPGGREWIIDSQSPYFGSYQIHLS